MPWNVMGIPPEAKEAARAAAGLEGMSVGDWLTRRILAETGHRAPPEQFGEIPPSTNYRTRDDETRRDREDMVERVARTQSEAEYAFRRIEDLLRAMTRRLETTERSQSESNRTVSAAAQEINIAAREQAQAFDALTQRIERLEHNGDNSSLRDAVRGLHQGMSPLADQIARTATESANQLGVMAGNIETLAGKVTATREESVGQITTLRHESTNMLEAAEARITTVEERIRATEARVVRWKLRSRR